MARLIPYFLMFAFGFFVAMTIYARRRPANTDGELERKYRKLSERHHDLSRQLRENASAAGSPGAHRLRGTLWDVRGMIGNPDESSPARLRAALDEIDAALRETGEPGRRE